jgi:hypothetical protein
MGLTGEMAQRQTVQIVFSRNLITLKRQLTLKR